MARPKRLNIAGVPQHLVQRGNDRQACFRDDVDFRLYLELLKIACERHSCEVHAYVLMTNHVHLLMTPWESEGVSLVFRDLGRDYVRQFNRRYGRTGTLWEGRFKSSLVDSENYLLACYRYIELNPVRACMVKDPSEYHWSSFRTNALGESDELVVPHYLWRALGKDQNERLDAYRSLFGTTINSEEIQAIRDGLNKGLPTGHRSFTRSLEKRYSVKFGNGKRGRPKVKNVSGPI